MSLPRRTFLLGAGAVTVDVAVGAARAPFAWPRGKRAAVSLTYDDSLNSQLDNAVPQLDALSLKATFFLTQENMQERRDQWIALSKAGHEIADHTATHPCKLKDYTAERFRVEEIAPVERYLDAGFDSPAPRAYAYPCGFVKLGGGTERARLQAYASVVRPAFYAARTVDGPPNDPGEVVSHRYFLNGYEPTYERDDARAAKAYIGRAIAHGGWAILIFHEVLRARAGEGDTSVAVHQAILDHIVGAPVWCAPMRTIFNYVAGTARPSEF
jgi:peptidoglycan/xylan/chitin deacetylase (PgdA/CDA1 family)